MELTPCVLCDCPKDKDGYGRTYYAPTGKTEFAHRVAYAEHHGLAMADIAGVQIRHKCDTPACRNPEHLIAGTNADNVKDKVSRNRQARGETNGQAVLTEDQVKEIKRRISNGQIQSIIAKEFGVSRYAITDIKCGKSWAHVV